MAFYQPSFYESLITPIYKSQKTNWSTSSAKINQDQPEPNLSKLMMDDGWLMLDIGWWWWWWWWIILDGLMTLRAVSYYYLSALPASTSLMLALPVLKKFIPKLDLTLNYTVLLIQIFFWIILSTFGFLLSASRRAILNFNKIKMGRNKIPIHLHTS